MGTPEVSGNQGLRDQVEALKTVQVQILSISKAICQRPLETDRMDLLKALDKFKIQFFHIVIWVISTFIRACSTNCG